MAKASVFRKVALERLSSPEQLDQLIQVTRPSSWLALGALGLLIAAAVVWSFYGSIPTEAPGSGILLRRGGVADVVATGAGQVEEMLVEVGGTVAAGRPVATVRQDVLQRQIEDAESRLADLRVVYAELEDYAQRQQSLQAENLVRKRANLDRSIETRERDVEILLERLRVERDLLGDGLVTQQMVLASERELNSARDALASLRLEREALALERLESEQRLEEQLEGRRREIRDLEMASRELRAQRTENARVLSPYGGRVLELSADAGDVVNPGTPLLSIEIASEELVAVLFVPAGEGKRVVPGMHARVSPSTFRPEEYGYLLGRVAWVAEFPSTSGGMLRLLSNQALVEQLMAQGPLIQVDVVLTRDPSTPTGFRWSSSEGPELPITSGTVASGSVVVRRDRPIALAIPTLREKLGV